MRPLSEAEIRELLRRRSIALGAAEHVRAGLPLVEPLAGLSDVLAAKAANRLELAAIGLERLAEGCARELRPQLRIYPRVVMEEGGAGLLHLSADLVAAIQALDKED